MSTDSYRLYENETPDLTGFERTLFDAISSEEPWALVEEFADLVRESGSEDERAAAAYLEDRLASLGVPHERYDPELWLSHPREASLNVVSPRTRSYDAVKTVSFSGSGTVSGEVVRIEPPETTAERGQLSATLETVDQSVEGNIALVEANYLSREMILSLEDAGAVGIVGVQENPREPHEGIATPVWGAVPHPAERDRVPEVVIVNTTSTVGAELYEAADSGAEFVVEVSASAPRDWYRCPLVVARIPGEAAPGDDDFVLLHGHYDSWHVGVTDNATGDAGLLELARVFNEHRDELRRDLWVAWWPAHSTGRYAGSTWFVDEFALALHDRCVAHVNMDSPGVEGATEFTEGVQWMPEVHRLCRDAIMDTCGKESNEYRVKRAGDYSFNNLGISGMFMGSSGIPMAVRERRGWPIIGGSGGHAEAWHLSTDTLDKADPAVLVRDTRVYATVLARLLTPAVLPIDHRRTVEKHDAYLAALSDETDGQFSLEPVVSALGRLEDAVHRFYDEVDSGSVDSGEANRVIKGLSRTLVHVEFAADGRFEQDPATHRPPYAKLAPAATLSALEGDDRKFQSVHLTRARNEVVSELRKAHELVTSVV